MERFLIGLMHVTSRLKNSPPSLVCTKFYGNLRQLHVVIEWVLFSALLLLEYIDEIITGLG